MAERLAKIAQDTPEVQVTYTPAPQLIKVTKPEQVIFLTKKMIDFKLLHAKRGTMRPHRLTMYFDADGHLLTWYFPVFGEMGEESYVGEIAQIAHRTRAYYIIHVAVISAWEKITPDDITNLHIQACDLSCMMQTYGAHMNDFFVIDTKSRWQYFPGERGPDLKRDPLFPDRASLFSSTLPLVGQE